MPSESSTSAGTWLATSRPTRAVVDLGRLAHNLRVLRARAEGSAIIAVVKADAYGHGAVPVARRLGAEGVHSFAVALAEEGLELRRGGIRDRILLLGVLTPGQIQPALENDLTPTVFEPSLLEALDQEGRARARRIAVHVKLDTGMGRIGFPPADHESLARRLAGARGLELAGVFIHFAAADDPDDPETTRQLARLDDFLAHLREAGLDPGLVHAAGSAGILAHPAARGAAVRPGLALYGLHPSDKVPRADLRPVLSLESRVIQVKDVPEGAAVGYGRTWRATGKARIATLPVGFADGYPRALSNRGRVLFDAGEARVAGRVSMDMITVDVGGLPGIEVGTGATLIGERSGRSVTAGEIAAVAETIPYEILCGIGRRVPRVYVEEGRVVEARDPFGPGGPG